MEEEEEEPPSRGSEGEEVVEVEGERNVPEEELEGREGEYVCVN